MKLSTLTQIGFLLATTAAALPAQTATATADDKTSPKSWSMRDLDAPISDQLGFPRWIRLAGQYRGRLEDDTALSFVPGAADTYYLERVRVDLYVLPTPWLTIKAEMQDSRNFLYGNRPLAANTYDPFDLREGYVEIGKPESNGFDVKVGRQEVSLGSKRLVGPGEWKNAGGPFDAARGSYKMNGAKFEFFAGSYMAVDPTVMDTHIAGEHLYYTYESFTKLIPKASIEPYYLLRTQMNIKDELGHVGNSTLSTGGVRVIGVLPARVDYSSETAWQWGRYSGDRVAAMAGSYTVGWTVVASNWKPRASIEFDHASGDTAQKDGLRQTFDSLYAGHGAYTYGMADMVGWRNIRSARAGVDFVASKRLKLRTDFLEDYLASTKDGLYNSGGVLKVINRNATSRHVGSEADVLATYQLSRSILVTAGFSHLFPGAFLKQSTKGSGYSSPFLMWTKNF
jgi:Alginate export